MTDPDRTKVELVDPLVGTVVDRRYRVEFRIAAGGFGAIYHATDLVDRREVALKVLHARVADDRAVIARFRREGEALAQLRDLHTITFYAFGEADGVLYIAMELLHGESLYEQFRARGPLPWPRVVAIARDTCSALGEAHALGIVHRDLKPANIHLERRGDEPDFVKVLDFGIAKVFQGSALDRADLTHAGQMIGTFDYMAPEQMVGGTCTGRSDIFSLGIVIYEMISGERPFGAPHSPTAMLAAVIGTTPAPLSTCSDAPVALDAVVARCIHRVPEHRFSDVGELADELDRVLAPDDERTRNNIAAAAPGDDETWIDSRPMPAMLGTTLPGIVPPVGPWPIKGPKRGR